ncbi:MAG: hypothetical protein IJA72_04450 [Clostridia bacterium]|nr:hypothetical protein [Clostridia bacterium]
MSKYNKLKKEILNHKHCPKLISDDNSIDINIIDSSEILSPYTEDNRPIITNDFAEFLNNSVKDISIKQNISINISTQNGNAENISNAVKTYYYNEFVDVERKLKFNLLSSMILLIVGIIAFAVSIAQYIAKLPVLAGAIDIYAWVFMWEAFDLFFFRRTELKYQQRRYANFITAKINLK